MTLHDSGAVNSGASEAAMKAILATFIALSFLAGLADDASAATNRKHKSKYKAYANRQAYTKGFPNGGNGPEPDWYPHDSNALPFGSQLWWRQKERESGGGSRN